MSGLTWMPGWELLERIKTKELSPVEVVRHYLERIERLEPDIHAYITVDGEGALKQAKAAEEAVMGGADLGPLHGLPISIKDLYNTTGLRTTMGSALFEHFVPDYDEILVERLKKAGAIIIGKTQTPEFASFDRTVTPFTEECMNPWDLKRSSGHSSGGAGAAAAAGMTPWAIGSDGGGSTRNPAAYNGVVGFQPSAGRIPMRNPVSMPSSSAGPMTLHVRDAAAIIQAIAGKDPRDPSAIEEASPDFLGELDKGISGLKIAWTGDWGVVPEEDAAVTELVRRAVLRFSEAGAAVEEPSIVMPDEETTHKVFTFIAAIGGGRLSMWESFTAEQLKLLTPRNQAMIAMAKDFKPDAKAMRGALEYRAILHQWMSGWFSQYDLICTPTAGRIAPIVPEDKYASPYDGIYAERSGVNHLYIANALGLPAISVPCGFSDGMPVGMHIVGPRFSDTLVMRAAQAFSQIQPWMDRHPVIAGGINE